MAKNDGTIEPINGTLDDVAEAITTAITPKFNKNKVLKPTPGVSAITPGQGMLNLQIEKQIEVDGLGMGVLTDGTPFLTGRGLARLCGISNARIVELGADWHDERRALTKHVKEILALKSIVVDTPHIEINQRSGAFYAYPDVVCVAVLEYYAFDAGDGIRDTVIKNYRLLAGKALHDFIYSQVGYDPGNHVPAAWRQFHDRVSLTYNAVPVGYFSVFKEIADMIVTLGQAGLAIDSSFVPDESVGIHWAKHWKDNKLADQYGERKEWEHNYPDYFPQSKSNSPNRNQIPPIEIKSATSLSAIQSHQSQNFVGGCVRTTLGTASSRNTSTPRSNRKNFQRHSLRL